MSDKTENKYIGLKIKKLRKEKGLTMAQLGALVNLQESTVNRYEQGKIRSLDINILKRFSDVLDTTIHELTSNTLDTLAKSINVSPSSIAGWEESPIQDKYNQLTDEQKKIIDLLLDEFTK